MLTDNEPAMQGRTLCPEPGEPPEKLFERVILPTLTVNADLGIRLVEFMVAARQALDAINGVLGHALLTETDKDPLRAAASELEKHLNTIA